MFTEKLSGKMGIPLSTIRSAGISIFLGLCSLNLRCSIFGHHIYKLRCSRHDKFCWNSKIQSNDKKIIEFYLKKIIKKILCKVNIGSIPTSSLVLAQLELLKHRKTSFIHKHLHPLADAVRAVKIWNRSTRMTLAVFLVRNQIDLVILKWNGLSCSKLPILGCIYI